MSILTVVLRQICAARFQEGLTRKHMMARFRQAVAAAVHARLPLNRLLMEPALRQTLPSGVSEMCMHQILCTSAKI
jgi:hypothetical protein